jgi:UDP-N-acetylmuramate--alanine ligase
VAGTHGKTTTSSMIAHILKNAGANVSAFLGGITSNYNTNLLIGMPTEKIDRMPNVPPFGKHLCVVEADEYDRSFLTLFPDIAVVTSTDADHLDIYGEHEELKNSFNLFINQIKVKGHLVIHRDLTYKLNKDKIIYVHQYSGKGGDFSANNIRVENGKFVFDYKAKTQEIKNIELLIPGFHNVENAVAAINVCILLEVPAEDIKAGLESFMGVKRRFEYIVRTEQKIFIDDYAHHPTEIEAFLTSVKTLYPNKKLTCVFQPHLFSRTRDFADGFSKSLSIADEVILLDIYPAREKPIDGVDSNLILKNITSPQKLLLSKEDLLKYISTKPSEVLVTVGAGDIDALVPKIKDIILNEKN